MIRIRLIDCSLSKKTPTIEIIRRLLRNGIVEHKDDQADKQSKRQILNE
jgi:hypothetical protein